MQDDNSVTNTTCGVYALKLRILHRVVYVLLILHINVLRGAGYVVNRLFPFALVQAWMFGVFVRADLRPLRWVFYVEYLAHRKCCMSWGSCGPFYVGKDRNSDQ